MGQRTTELTAAEAQLVRLALNLFQAHNTEAARRISLESQMLFLPDERHLRNEFVTQGIWGVSHAIESSSLPSERKARTRRVLVRLANKITSAISDA